MSTLVLAETVSLAPGHIAGSQLVFKICGIDVNHIIFPHNTSCRAVVTEWNAEAAVLIVDEADKGYLPFRT